MKRLGALVLPWMKYQSTIHFSTSSLLCVLAYKWFFYHCLFGNFFFQEFIGNINKDTVVLHDLSPPITARYVRFLPLEWISHISMRVELYGCHGK